MYESISAHRIFIVYLVEKKILFIYLLNDKYGRSLYQLLETSLLYVYYFPFHKLYIVG